MMRSLMRGHNFVDSRPGFTLVEIMIVVAIMVIAIAITAPRMMKKPEHKWDNIVETINGLVSIARQQAISQHKKYQLTFNAQQELHTISVEEPIPDPEHPGADTYRQASCFYASTQFVLPEFFSIKGVYLGKQELLENNKQQASCIVFSDGLVQDVTILLAKVSEENAEESGITMRMLPFYGRFEYSEGFERTR